MMTQRTLSRATQTEAPPKELLEYGKLDAKAAAIFWGQIVSASLFGALLLLGAWFVIPKAGYSGDWEWPSLPRAIFIIAFVVLAVLCWYFAFKIGRKLFAEWDAHTDWVADVREHWLASSKSRAGLVTLETGTELTLKPTKFNDLVVTVVAIHTAVERGDPTPWTISALRGEDGPLGLSDGNHAKYFGSFSPKGAELAADALTQAGLIVGRKQGYAGRWAPRDLSEALQMLSKGVR
jgi:hypothetical protein